MDTELETLILKHLVQSDDYARQVIPFLKQRYFGDIHRLTFRVICDYVAKYNTLPSQEALSIEIQDSDRVNEQNYSSLVKLTEEMFKADVLTDMRWMLNKTEKWCQDQAIMGAVMDSIEIIEGKSKELDKGAIPSLLQDALGVSFDRSIGHDYFDDYEARYDFYQRKEEKIPFDLEIFNKITKGGFSKKTLNVYMAPTGVGKSLKMCHDAGANLSAGLNVLYITLEMAEERIAERIDANLLDIELGKIEGMPKSTYSSKMGKVMSKSNGKLIIKEYPTGSANVNHFRALLEELKLKKKFAPDIIYIDYLNICSSSRLRSVGGAINTYVLVKSIAEEIRGLAVEYNVPIVSATQTNRNGYNNSDIDLGDTSESTGLPATVDFMMAITQTDDMVKLGQFACKQLKNRYEDKNKNERFCIGVEKGKMRLFEINSSQASMETTDNPIADQGAISARTSKFQDFKFD